MFPERYSSPKSQITVPQPSTFIQQPSPATTLAEPNVISVSVDYDNIFIINIRLFNLLILGNQT